VVRALASNTGWATGGQVHRLAGMGSDNGVRAVLAALVDQGLVLFEPAGRAVLYKMNPEHVLYGPLVTMSRVRAEIIRRITDEIESWSNAVPVWHASMFGSFARGEAEAGSDIDVASLGDLLKADDPLVASWRADAVHLTGTPLLQMLREVRVRCGMPLQSLAMRFARLLAMKGAAHYSAATISANQAEQALKIARDMIDEADAMTS
jgi:hypothetical protein